MNKKLYFLFVCLSSGFFLKAMEQNKKIALQVSALIANYPDCLTYIIEEVSARSSDCQQGCRILMKEDPGALSNYVTILSLVTQSVEARLREEMCITYCSRCKKAVQEALDNLSIQKKQSTIH